MRRTTLGVSLLLLSGCASRSAGTPAGSEFAGSSFRRRFEQKGRFAAWLAQVPTYVITAEYPAFLGVSAILADKLPPSA